MVEAGCGEEEEGGYSVQLRCQTPRAWDCGQASLRTALRDWMAKKWPLPTAVTAVLSWPQLGTFHAKGPRPRHPKRVRHEHHLTCQERLPFPDLLAAIGIWRGYKIRYYTEHQSFLCTGGLVRERCERATASQPP